MKKTSILITGAAGFMGPSIMEAATNIGLRIIAVDQKDFDTDSNVEKIIADFRALPKILQKTNDIPDIVLHLAWQGGFQHDNPIHIKSIPDHFDFLKDMMHLNVRQIAAMGTMHEVGYWQGSIDEGTPNNPGSLYGIAKNALRQAFLLEAEKNGMAAQWLRAFYILSDNGRGNSLFAKIINWEKEGKSHFPMNSGDNMYDFVTLDELSRQIIACVSQTSVTGIINCCSGKPEKLRDVIQEFISRNGLKIRPRFGEFPDRAYDSPAIWGDSEKINLILRDADRVLDEAGRRGEGA